jgi:hypothetical protein
VTNSVLSKRNFVICLLICAGVLAVVGLKKARRLQTTSPRYHCITVLKQISGAKATWALDKKKRNEDVPSWSDLLGKDRYISEMPVCPQSGSYTIGAIAEHPRCSVPGHTL